MNARSADRNVLSSMYRSFAVLLTLPALLLCVDGRALAQEILAARFEQTSGSAGAFERHYSAVRRGKSLDAIRLIAPVTIQAGLDPSEAAHDLEFLAAPVFNLGDGMRLEVFVDGRLRYTRYFDAGRRAEDRDWVPVQVPLESVDISTRTSSETEPARRLVMIRLSGGPQGDLDADWLAIASMHLSRRGQ